MIVSRHLFHKPLPSSRGMALHVLSRTEDGCGGCQVLELLCWCPHVYITYRVLTMASVPQGFALDVVEVDEMVRGEMEIGVAVAIF